MGLLSFCLLWLAAPVASRVLDDPGLVGVLRGSALTLLIAPLGLVQRSLLARELRFRALAKIELAAAVGGTATALALAAAGAGVAALVSRMVVTAAVGAALAWRAHSWRPRSMDFKVLDFGLRDRGAAMAIKTERALSHLPPPEPRAPWFFPSRG